VAVGATPIWLAGKTIEPNLGLNLINPPAWLDRSIGLVSIYVALRSSSPRNGVPTDWRKDAISSPWSLHWSLSKRRQRLWLCWRNSGGTIRKLPIGSTV
jgi:hypothetical protein